VKDQRGPWFLLTGLAIGLAIGVLFSWLIEPVQFLDTAPASLHPDFRSEYRALIAQAYMADGDIGRAQSRLALLGDPDPVSQLKDQTIKAKADQRPQREVEALAALAQGLEHDPIPPDSVATTKGARTPAGSETPAGLETTATPQQEMMILTATPTPLATVAPRATATPRAILRAAFKLSDRQEVCDPDLPEGLLQIEVLDSSGRPVAGVKIVATWDGGENAFYTGLNPRISPGYADFRMETGRAYSLQVGEGGEPVARLEPVHCSLEGAEENGGATATPGAAYWGGWRLRFVEQ